MTDPSQTTPPGGPEGSRTPPGGPPRTPPGGPGDPPPFHDWNGGQTPPGGYGRYRGLPDLSPLLALLEALWRLVPPELQDQFNTLQRELLLTARALIDWRLERLEAGEQTPAVEEIPID